MYPTNFVLDEMYVVAEISKICKEYTFPPNCSKDIETIALI